ncbi:MAG: hypothetical protein H6741_02615 [Alphaproteobacteria bacterium]|nr:hypothetical protein [Alphaproteobacteria bacterium]MCB9791597.1 hypothetical protein [Alphaproteobacteria bacterium]
MKPSVVLGSGPSALRAAARIEGALRIRPAGEARVAPELPEDRGIAEASPAGLEAMRSAYGAAPPADDFDMGLWINGRAFSLPFRRRQLLEVFPPEKAPGALRGWARARGRAELRKIIGGGLEQRSYRDWSEQRFGPGVYAHLHRSYGQARFGDPEQVNISAARQHFSMGPRHPLVGLGGSPEAGWRRLEAAAGAAQDAHITGLEVGDKGVSAVITEEGRVEIEGPLWCAVSPARLAGWLGSWIPVELRTTLLRLRSRHRVQVALRRVGGGAALPAELHVADPAPFFRVSDPERLPGAAALEGLLIAHLSLSEQDPLWRGSEAALVDAVVASFEQLGLPRVEAQGARVDRLWEYDPEWLGPWHPFHVRITDALAKLNVRLVGRAGMHRFIDAAQELELVDALLQSPKKAHEHARVLLDPPVTLDDQQASFTRFVER